MAAFGDSSSAGSEFPGQDGRCLVSRFTCSTAGTVTSMTAWFGASSTAGANFKLVILADSGGVPGATLIVSSAGAIPAGGGSVSVSASGSVSASTDYWLGVVADSHQGYYGDGASGVEMLMANGSYTYATPPSWPGTDATYSGYHISVSATYTEGGGGDVSVALTGVAGVGTIGSVAPTRTVPLTQAAGTGAIGSVAVSNSHALTQVAGVGAVGTVVPSRVVPVTGVAGGGAVGSVTPAPSIGLTQVAGVGAVGSVSPAASVPLTQVSGTGAVGTVSPSQAGTVGLTGVSGTGAVGTLGPASSVPITGNAGVGAVGSVGASVSIALTGVAGVGAVGSVAPASAVPLSGVSGSGEVGSVAVLSADVVVALTGVQAIGSVGSVLASGGDAVATGSLGFEMGGGDPKPRRRSLVYIDADEPRSSAQEAPQPARLDFETARQKAGEIIKAAATEHAASRVSKPVRFGYVRTSLKPLAESLGNWNWINQYQRMYDAALNEQLRREIEIADQLEEDSAIAFLLMNL